MALLSLALTACSRSIVAPANPKSLSEYIKTLATQEISDRNTPGFSIAVVRHGKVVYTKGFGYSNVGLRTPATQNTTYVIGSITKQFTAAAILLLAQEHKLSLNDSLAKYFPQFDGAERITVRNLLGHTSGLHNYPNPDEHKWPTSGQISPTHILAILQRDTLDFNPGQRFEYSNSNYAVLAAIVAKVSGEPYGEFLDRSIFRPLRMGATASGELAYNRYLPAPGYNTVMQKFVPAPHISLDLFYGAGSIVSNVLDMAKWDTALLHGTLLSPASLKEMFSTGRLKGGEATGYGFGFVPATMDGHRFIWHNGLTPGAGYCFNALFFDDDLAIVILSNGADFAPQPELMTRKIFEFLAKTTVAI